MPLLTKIFTLFSLRKFRISDIKDVSDNARKNLQEVISLLTHLDEKFGEIASKAPAPVMSQSIAKKSPIAKPSTVRSTSKNAPVMPTGKELTTRTISATSGGGSTSAKRALSGNKPKSASQRPSDAEKKRLKKELDKLMKAHRKANKVLDDFRNEKSESR